MTALATAYVRLRVDGSQLPSDIKRTMTSAGSTATSAGRTAGSKFSSSFGRSAVSGAKTTAGGVDRALVAGAISSGTGYGKRFGVAMRGTISDYAKGTGAALVGFFAFEKVKEALSFAISEGREAQKVGAQTTSVIAATGSAANVTADQIGTLSNALSRKAGVDDEVIQSGANVLLTFRNVRNEVGKGNDVFDRGLSLAVDMSAALGTDLRSASLQLGKALNDPVRGMTALTRAGVTFDDQQRANVARLVESGDVMGAQKIILRELAAEFQGSARAQRTAGDQLSVAYGNLAESLGTKLLPKLDEFESWLATDGFSAVQTFGGAVDDSLLQPLGQLFDLLGSGLGLLDDLPDGLAQSAIQVGLLYGGLRLLVGAGVVGGLARVSSGMETLALQSLYAKDAVVGAGGGLKGTATVALQAGRQLLTSKAGALGLAIGLQALDSQVGDSNQTLHGLLTVGSAVAAGFATGSPVIAGIAGFASLVQLAGERSAKTAEYEAQLAGQAQSVAQALDAQTGALTKNARAAAEKFLADSNAYDAAAKIGVSYTDVTKAALGNEAALTRITAASRAYAEQNGVVGLGIAGSLLEAIHASTTAIDGQRQSLDQTTQAESGFTDSSQSAAAALRQQARDARDALNAHNQLAEALLEAAGGEISFRAAVRDAIKAGKDSNAGVFSQTKAGDELKQNLIDVAGAWNNLNNRAKNAAGSYREHRQDFISVAEALGVGSEKAKQLADNWLTTTAKINSRRPNVDVDTSGAQSKIAAVRSALNLVDGMTASATVTINTILNTAANQQAAYNARNNAQGAVYMASGGLRQPMVTGQPILWGEAGPEAYIPLVGPSDPRHGRAVDLLGETARALGARAMASGDVFHVGGVPQLSDQWQQIRDLLQVLRSDGIKDDRRDALLGKIHDTADKMRSEVKDELSDARDSLHGLLQSQRQLATSISSQFQTASVYGEGAPSSAQDLFTRARAQVNDDRLFQHVLRQLKAHGANPALLSALASAGPGAIVQAQALAGLSRKELNRYEHLIGAGNQAAGGIGGFVSQQVYGDRVRDARHEFKDMQRAYEKLDHRLDELPRKTARAISGELEGVSVKMDGRKVGELISAHHDRVDRGG